MKWSWKLGTIAGIGIYVHWTFLILIGWIVIAIGGQGGGLQEILGTIGFIIALFACIVAHELGHALTARRYNIRTRDITLLPIGGMARLERMPEEPMQEFLVAIAGPLVNVAIAAVLLVALVLVNAVWWPGSWEEIQGSFLLMLLVVNVVLVAFNVLPAFPMDGGRMLRAILSGISGDYVWATQIAATVGQFMAILFAIVGLFVWFNPFLVFIALFVFLGAQAEAHLVQIRSIFHGLPVRVAMMTHFRALSPRDTLGLAADELLAGAQQDFPIVEDGHVIGVLERSDMIKALGEAGRDVPVSEIMKRDCVTVEEGDMLQRTFERMQEKGCRSVPVLRKGQLVGLVTLENVGELMMVHSALKQKPAGV